MRTPSNPVRPFHGRHAAFSLVECVLAIAIATVSILTMVALLPGGLNDLRRSAVRQAEARIEQAIVADFQMRSWGAASDKMTLPSKDYYFDYRGSPVRVAGVLEHIFTARAQVQSAPAMLNGDRDAARHLLRVSIRITDVPDNPKALDEPRLYRERGVWVANFDQTKLGGKPQQ